MTTIRIVGKTVPRINITSSTVPRIDPALIAAALGAEPKPVPLGETFGPFLPSAIREALNRLPPALIGDQTHGPPAGADWAELEHLLVGILAKLPRESLQNVLAAVQKGPQSSPARGEAGAPAKPG